MKLREFIFVLFLVIAFLTFFSPILGVILTGNWWLFLLFIVSWIPALVIGKIGAILYDGL